MLPLELVGRDLPLEFLMQAAAEFMPILGREVQFFLKILTLEFNILM
jgi:hypothetical protein